LMAEAKTAKGIAPDRVTISFNQLLQQFEEERHKLSGYDQRRANVQGVINEAQAALAALDAVEKAGRGEKILVPLGSGVYVDAIVDDVKTVKSALTADVITETSLADAKKALNKRVEEFTKSFNKLVGHEQHTLKNLQNMEQVIRRISQRRQAGGQAQAKGTA